MNTMSIAAGVAARPAPKHRAAGQQSAAATPGRQFSLVEAVRDLAGWTLPAYRPEAGRQPDAWQLA